MENRSPYLYRSLELLIRKYTFFIQPPTTGAAVQRPATANIENGKEGESQERLLLLTTKFGVRIWVIKGSRLDIDLDPSSVACGMEDLVDRNVLTDSNRGASPSEPVLTEPCTPPKSPPPEPSLSESFSSESSWSSISAEQMNSYKFMLFPSWRNPYLWHDQVGDDVKHMDDHSVSDRTVQMTFPQMTPYYFLWRDDHERREEIRLRHQLDIWDPERFVAWKVAGFTIAAFMALHPKVHRVMYDPDRISPPEILRGDNVTRMLNNFLAGEDAALIRRDADAASGFQDGFRDIGDFEFRA